MKRPVASLAALAGAVLLTCAACSSGDDPGPNYSSVSTTPTASTSPAPTDSSSPTGVPSTGPNVKPGEAAPTEPATARVGSAEGAQAFETYYIKLVDWVYATSQPKILLPLYDPSCVNCANFASNLTGQVANGSTFRGSRIMIQRLALVANDGRNDADYAVSVEISASALTILDAAGTVTDQGPATTLTLTNWVHWTGDKWLIVDQGKA